MSDNVENGGDNAIREFARAEHDTRKEVMPPTDKIRLLIIGRTGVGKSTLISRVFGVPELLTNVSHDSPGQHDIDVGMTYDENRGIVVHDTGGFEGGDDTAVQKVKDFIRSRRAEKYIKDQIHCIWYCIACEGGRPVQGFEREFFKNIAAITGDIPVIVIFTKYDALVAQHQGFLGVQNPDWSNGKTRQLAEGLASLEYESIYRKQVQDLLKSSKKVDIEQVRCVQSPTRGGAQEGDPYNETGANGLIQKTENSLEYSLRPMWVSTQQLNAELKVNASVVAGMTCFRSSASLAAIPFIPVKDLAVEMLTSDKIFSHIHDLWNKEEVLFPADSETRALILDAIFNKNLIQQIASATFDIIDIIGPLSQPNNAVKFMKTVAGVTLLHEQLFWYQKSRIANLNQLSLTQNHGINGAGKVILPLRREEVDEVVQTFRTSDLRKDMCDKIDSNLSKYGLNLMKSYSSKEVEGIIRNALRNARQANSEWRLQ